jgi:hypothetical protein
VHNVNCAIGIERRIAQCLDRLLRADVGWHRGRVVAGRDQLVGDEAQPAFIDVGDHHLHALLREPRRRRSADAARGSSDDSYLVRQHLHFIPPELELN